MYDIIIVGAGTAGMSAAIYGQRAGKKTLILEKANYGGQIINTPEIENYPGISKISGYEFATGLYNQAKDLGTEIVFESVESIQTDGEVKKVLTPEHTYEAKTVILATGAKNRRLNLPREQELVGAGISYCATCDGMFFRGKDVAVNGGGNTALEDALFLSNYCNKVYVIHRRDAFRGENKLLDSLKKRENVEFVLNSVVTSLNGEDMLESVTVKDKISGEEHQIPVSGLFVAIGQEPESLVFADIVDRDEKGYIRAGENCHTNVEGIYTAGDCRTKNVRQLTTAASDGAVAALAACEYLDSREG